MELVAEGVAHRDETLDVFAVYLAGRFDLEPDDGAFPPEHPRRRRLRTIVGSVAYDLLPPASPLRRLYDWHNLIEFIRLVLDRPTLYHLADPLGALSINVFQPGGHHAWHFDETEYRVFNEFFPTVGDHFRRRMHRADELGSSDRNPAHCELEAHPFADNGSVLDQVFVDTCSDRAEPCSIAPRLPMPRTAL